jgi:glycosyltransferase involved in cell wall biosynthesis
MIEVEGVAPERTTFIPLGISPDAPPTGHDVRAELGIPAEAQVVVAVGNLRPQKAHQVLIAAIARIAERWPDMQVLVVGVGPRREELEQLSAELGLQRVIRFLGYRSDVPDVLAAADVAVCSSDFEGTPIAILEYMEAGVAVVSTAVGGVPDVIEDGVHGLLVPRRDPDALAGAISELLADPQRAREMGARGRERRRSEFTLEALIDRLEALYRELADTKRSA